MRIQFTKNHSPFLLEDLYNQLESKIKYDLSSATMPAMSLADLLGYYSEGEETPVIARSLATKQSSLQEQLIKELLDTKLSYSEQYGSLKTREKLSKLYNLSPENFLLTSGASEAIFLVMFTMFEPGDTIIVQQPIYQSLYQIAKDRGVQVIDWAMRHPEGAKRPSGSSQVWSLEKLEEIIKQYPETKALVINNPNNPTGLGFKREELKQIAELLDGRYLISDEVFLFISQSQLPSAIEVYENSIVISDLSKSFNMPGLRLGWIAVSPSSSRAAKRRGDPESSSRVDCHVGLRPPRNDDILKNFSSLKNYLSLRTNTLSETIAPWVLDKATEISSKNKELIKTNINHLYSLNQSELIFDLTDIPKEKIEGLCIFPKLKAEFENFDFNRLLEEQGIFIAQGSNFGEGYENRVRIGLRERLLHIQQPLN